MFQNSTNQITRKQFYIKNQPIKIVQSNSDKIISHQILTNQNSINEIQKEN